MVEVVIPSHAGGPSFLETISKLLKEDYFFCDTSSMFFLTPLALASTQASQCSFGSIHFILSHSLANNSQYVFVAKICVDNSTVKVRTNRLMPIQTETLQAETVRRVPFQPAFQVQQSAAILILS